MKVSYLKTENGFFFTENLEKLKVTLHPKLILSRRGKPFGRKKALIYLDYKEKRIFWPSKLVKIFKT